MSPLVLLLAVALAAPLHAASIPASDTLPAKADNIPVKVVLDDVVLDDVELEPAKHNEVDNEEIQRPAVDLRNPGPPQRQEHETQNPEQHSDEALKVSSIQESIERTRDMLVQSLKETSANVQSWLTSSDDQSHIQKSIQSLRDTFSNQIQKLNNTIHDLIKPEEAQQVMPEESERKIDVIDSKLKGLKDSFNNGIETLSAGVELAAMLKLSPEDDAEAKQEGESSSVAPAEAPTTTSPANAVVQFFQTFGQNLSNQLNSMVNVFQRPQTATPPAGAQADTPSETQSPGFRPPAFISGWINNLSQTFPNWTQNFQNIPNPIQGIQQGLSNINPFRPTSTGKPAEAASSATSEPVKTDPSSEPNKPAADKPVEAEKPVEATTQTGPIRQFLNSIPVVQRIQSSLGNRDTPRQPAATAPTAAPAAEAAAAPAPAAVPALIVPAAETSSQTKGGFYGGYKPGVSNDSNNSNGVSEQRSEEVKEKEPIKEEVKEPMKEEIKKDTEETKPEPVADKTE